MFQHAAVPFFQQQVHVCTLMTRDMVATHTNLLSPRGQCHPSQVCNLSTMLVVSDRATALAVVAHYRDRRVGRVTCRILSELTSSGAGNRQQPQQQRRQHGRTEMTPLTSLVVASDPAVAPLLESLLGGWALVGDAAAALGLLAADRGGLDAALGGRCRDLVTPRGEVFKADGEIVAGPAAGARGKAAATPASSMPYCLQHHAAAIPSERGPAAAAPDAAAERQQQQERKAAAEAVARLEGQVLRVGTEAVEAQGKLSHAQCDAAELRRVGAKLEAAAVAAEAAAERQRRRQDGGASGRLEGAEKQLADARKAAADAHAQQQAAQLRAADLSKQLECARAALPGGSAATAVQQAAATAAAARAAADAARMEAARARQAARRAASQVAALKKQLSGNGCNGVAEAEASRLQVGVSLEPMLAVAHVC